MTTPERLFPETGSLLGVDFGQRRVGLALCDTGRMIASPLRLYVRRNPELDAAFFRQLVQQHAVVGLVVGLPLHMRTNQEGELAQAARAFGQWLMQTCHLPVVYFDERLTSTLAEGLLSQAGLTAQQRRERIDKVAAQILLQSFLDAGCPTEPLPPDKLT